MIFNDLISEDDLLRLYDEEQVILQGHYKIEPKSDQPLAQPVTMTDLTPMKMEPYHETTRTFRSPLEIYALKTPFSMRQLLLFWKNLQFLAKKRHLHRQQQLLFIHRTWESILTDPDRVAALLQKETIVTAPKKIVKTPLNVEKLSRLNSTAKLLPSRQNVHSLLQIQTIEDFLFHGKVMDQLADCLKSLFAAPEPFIRSLLVSGPVGLGKKSLLKYILEEILWVDVTWVSLVEQYDQIKPENFLRTKIDTQSLIGTRPQQLAIVIYDCDGLDPQGNTLLKRLYKSVDEISGQPWLKKQIVVIFVAHDIIKGPLNEIRMSRKVRKFALQPANSDEFRKFYSRLREKMKEINDEPLDIRTFPIEIQKDPSLYYLLEKHDIRALLNYVSYRWITMDALRDFPDVPLQTHRHTENRISLNCFDVTNLVLRQNVPPCLWSLFPQVSTRYNIQSLFAIFEIPAPGVTPNPLVAHCYQFDDPKMMAILPLMILTNMFPYALGFQNWKEYQNTLFTSSNSEILVRCDPRIDFKAIKLRLISIMDKLINYQYYKQSVPGAFKFLIQDLLMVHSLGNRYSKKKNEGFRTDYYGGVQEVRTKVAHQEQKSRLWQDSLTEEQKVYLFSMDNTTKNQCYHNNIANFDAITRSDITEEKKIPVKKRKKPEESKEVKVVEPKPKAKPKPKKEEEKTDKKKIEPQTKKKKMQPPKKRPKKDPVEKKKTTRRTKQAQLKQYFFQALAIQEELQPGS